MFDFDQGGSGSEGPWLVWSARGTQDDKVPPKTFYVRDADGGKRPVDLSKGVVLDVWNMKTGWQRSEGIAGQAPEWKWGASPAKLPEKPGEDWKKGFHIPVALSSTERVVWEQAGAAAWNAFVALIPALQAASNQAQLPVARLAGTKAEQFKRGSTVSPVLEIVKWVNRPACLNAGFDAGDDEPAPQPAAKPQAAAPAEAWSDFG